MESTIHVGKQEISLATFVHDEQGIYPPVIAMVDVVADTDDYPSLIESGKYRHDAELQFLCLKMVSSRPVTGQTIL